MDQFLFLRSYRKLFFCAGISHFRYDALSEAESRFVCRELLGTQDVSKRAVDRRTPSEIDSLYLAARPPR